MKRLQTAVQKQKASHQQRALKTGSSPPSTILVKLSELLPLENDHILLSFLRTKNIKKMREFSEKTGLTFNTLTSKSDVDVLINGFEVAKKGGSWISKEYTFSNTFTHWNLNFPFAVVGAASTATVTPISMASVSPVAEQAWSLFWKH